MATAEQIETIEHRRVDDVAREMMRDGVALTHDEADALGDAALDWLGTRLGLVSTTDEMGVTYRPREEARRSAATKDDVAGWESVATYVVTGHEDGAVDIDVQIGEADEGGWYIRTTDDEGGDDVAPSTRYASEEEARRAGEQLACELHEGGYGEDAAATRWRAVRELASDTAADGQWAAYSAGRIVSRHDYYAAAWAATEYGVGEVRLLVDGQWVPADVLGPLRRDER